MDAQTIQLPPELYTAEYLAAIEAELGKRERENQLERYRPYKKQEDFHAAGVTHRERLLMAGNQIGKSLSGSMEVAMHLTGLYPDWWQGRRWNRPTRWWVAGVTGESTRDNPQRLLVGQPQDASARGTGAVPKGRLMDCTLARGIPDALDSILVRHVSGGVSTLLFKSYEKGREKWQGDTLDGLWFDEEPDADIYTEGLTRTNATGGIVFMTFTPLKGVSDVVKRFLMEDNPDRHVTQMTIDDAEHYSAEERARIIASYPPHEREARVKGIPILGSGRVFPVEEAVLAEDAISIPKEWPRIVGLDIGWDHPTAAVWLAWDRDNDIVHVTDAYRLREATPVVHAAAIKARGAWIPVAWPHDGLAHDKGSGEVIAEQYRAQGVAMLSERATWDDGSNGVEAGLFEMLDRMQTGRWRVAKHLNDWWEEFRLYHRDKGRVVKEGDDLMSASRYGLMMLRYAQTAPRVTRPARRRQISFMAA